jgi:hypothetical protein
MTQRRVLIVAAHADPDLRRMPGCRQVAAVARGTQRIFRVADVVIRPPSAVSLSRPSLRRPRSTCDGSPTRHQRAHQVD